LRRLEPTLLTDQVYAVLHEAIISGELPGGTRLRIRDVAEKVGTSVMPVREAIRRLEEAGLAEREPHKGAVVKRLSLEELVHVYDMRRLVEGEAARLGSERSTAEDCERMQAEYDLLVTAVHEDRVVDHLDHDEALLTTLYAASGNPVLVDTIQRLWQHCRPYKIVFAQGALDAHDGEWLWRYQRDLIAAARAHDGAAALALSDASLDSATRRIKTLLAAQTPR
jgi:DNA-binding GntR family transcriptional regulator